MQAEHTFTSPIKPLARVHFVYLGVKYKDGLPAAPVDGKNSSVRVLRQLSERQASLCNISVPNFYNFSQCFNMHTGQEENLDDPNLSPWDVIYKLLTANEEKNVKVIFLSCFT